MVFGHVWWDLIVCDLNAFGPAASGDGAKFPALCADLCSWAEGAGNVLVIVLPSFDGAVHHWERDVLEKIKPFQR